MAGFFSRRELRKFLRSGNWIEEIHDSKKSLDIIFKKKRNKFVLVLLSVFMQAKHTHTQAKNV